MKQDEVEVYLESVRLTGDYEPEVSLRIKAYLTEGEIFDKNTLAFHCDPVGSNYESSYLQVTFDSWSKVADIREFLAHHFSDTVAESRALTVEVEDGVQSITPAGKPANETEGLEEITIGAQGDRIEFNRSGTALPYIHTYAIRTKSGEEDTQNAEKLIAFLDETIALHPDFHPEDGDLEDSNGQTILNTHRVEENLLEIISTDHEVLQDYQKAVREFESGEYADCIRDLGRASEVIIEVVVLQDREESEVPDRVGRRLNMLDKSEEGIPSFIGKIISPVWWLRNQVSHSNPYEPSEEEAYFALVSFQIATEKLIRDYLRIE